jgi:hypothetical protein
MGGGHQQVAIGHPGWLCDQGAKPNGDPRLNSVPKTREVARNNQITNMSLPCTAGNKANSR